MSREPAKKKYRSDRDLVTQFQKSRSPKKKMEAAYEMWDKYFKLRMKMRAQLAACCRNSGIYMPELYEEYDSEAWEKFILQFQGVRLEDVAHIKNWSIYIRLWGYWRSMNRDLIKKWIDFYGNNVPIYSTKDDSDYTVSNIDIDQARKGDKTASILELDSNRKLFWDSIDILREELNPQEKQLLNLKAQGQKNKDISEKMNITTKIIKENLTKIKSRLNDIIVVQSNKMGIQSDYTELLNSFGG